MEYIQLKNVDLKINGTNNPLISKINFSLNSGDKFLLSGTNGSGKSTFVKTLLGYIPVFDQPYASFASGTVNYAWDMKSITNNVIYIPQDDYISFPFKIVEDVFSESIKNLNYGKDYLKAWLNKYHPFSEDDMKKELLRKRVGALSGGERKYVAIIQSLFRCDFPDMKVIILDEPLNSLDSKHIAQLSNTLNLIARNNGHLAFLIISHCHIFPFLNGEYNISVGNLKMVKYECYNCIGACDSDCFFKI